MALAPPWRMLPIRRPVPAFPPAAARRALATALVAATALAGGACASIGGALGFSGPGPEGSVEVRNTASVGVNLYVLPRVGLREVFLGQVGPRATRRVTVPRHAPGDTVWLRARPVDGGAEYVRDGLVLGPASVWQIP